MRSALVYLIGLPTMSEKVGAVDQNSIRILLEFFSAFPLV